MKPSFRLLAASSCLALTACSPSPPGVPAVTVTAPATVPVPSSADAAVVRWVGGFCAAVHGYRERTNAEAGQAGPEPKSVAESQLALSGELGGLAARTGEAIDRLNALPAAPVPLAETVRKAFAAKFTTARDRAANAKTALDRARRGDQESQGPAAKALVLAQQDIDGTYDPVSPLTESPELVTAAAAAPECKS